MPAILAPPLAKRMSAFMFSATMVGALAEAGVDGVEQHAASSELLRPEDARALVLG
jgi:hypothetical protein